MKTIPLFNILAILIISNPSFAKSTPKEVFKDSHTTIYTEKIVRIVNAMNVGNFQTEKEYLKMLDTACGRNSCNNLEKQTIQNVGEQIMNCQIKHLKSHDIENSDAKNICESKQALLGCDSLSTPLLRKMCYSGNNYDLKALNKKEKHMKNRLPASFN